MILSRSKHKLINVLLISFVLIIGTMYHSVSWSRSSRSNLESRIEAIENKLASNLNIEISTKIEALQHEIQTLRGILEEYQHAAVAAQTTNSNHIKKSTDLLEKPTTQNTISATSKTPLIEHAKPESEQAAYDLAYKLLEDKNFPEAITAFKDFLWQYNNSKFSPNAMYWLGELYLTEHKFDIAADYFLQVVNKYKLHDKAPDALFKLGLLETERENWQVAKDYFMQIKKNYANSSRVYMAEAKLQSLQRDGH